MIQDEIFYPNKGDTMTKKQYYLAGAVAAVALLLAFFGADKTPTPTDIEVERSPIPVVREAQVTNIKNTKTIKRINASNASILVFNTEVNYDSVEMATAALYELDKLDKDIYILINSPGGSVFDGTRLFAHMKGTKNKVHTICETICASMAAHMFEKGNKRYMMDKSVLMFHPAAGGVRGTVPQMKSLLDLIDTYTQRLDMETATRSNIPYKDFELMVLKNLWIEADDAVSLKLADGYIIFDMDIFKQQAEYFNVRDELVKRGVKLTATTEAKIIIPVFQ